MPYIAELEKAGIPTVLIDLEDQQNMVRQEALAQGVPNIRFIHASRTLSGDVDVDRLISPVLDGLTRPLTEKEKESGMWQPPWGRVLFEGTRKKPKIFIRKQIGYPTRLMPLSLSIQTVSR